MIICTSENLCRAGTKAHFAPALVVRKMRKHRAAKIGGRYAEVCHRTVPQLQKDYNS